MNLDDDDDLSSLIRENATRHAAPHALRGSLRTQVALADVASNAAAASPAGELDEPPVQVPPPAAPPLRGNVAATRKPARWNLPWGALGAVLGWRNAGAGFAFGIACTLLAPMLWQRIGPGEPFEEQLVAEHVRAMRSGPLFDVASSDRHTVKPWFQGRIDYAPPVYDFTADGFPLLGGRVERFGGGPPLATLVYSRDRHMIDLVVAPRESAAAGPQTLVKRGFNVLHWTDGTMAYWAVSDVEHAELERFQQRWMREVAAR